jgi:predicted nucleic acid-binding protein
VFLVDTNVVSELTRKTPNRGALAWLGSHPTFALSAVTIEELIFGIGRAPVARRRELAEWLEELRGLVSAVLPVDEATARLSGELRAAGERTGRHMAQADALIAATAVIAGAVLVTRNVADFERCGVTMVNPFS